MAVSIDSPKGERVAWKADVGAAALCVVVGVAMSVLPHFQSWYRDGAPVWIADGDEAMYLAVASQAYFHHPFSLTDPVFPTPRPTAYPWIQFAPGILAAKSFDAGPLAISLWWRIWAGVTIGLAWYAALRHYIPRAWVAAGVAVILLADSGLLWVRPIVLQLDYVRRILAGRPGELLLTKPIVHPQWRIITPGLSLAFLLVHIWLVARARARPTWGRLIASGLGFAALIYTYFYYWTAATVALGLAVLLDRKHWRAYAATLVIGFACGWPALLWSYLLKARSPAGWLQRSDKFLPIPPMSELLIPKLSIGLLVLAFVFVWWRRRDLMYLWCLVAAAMALLNHQVITRLQIENFHWTYVWAPVLTLLLVLLVFGELENRRVWSPAAVVGFLVVAGLFLASGLWLRWVEASRTREAADHREAYLRYREQRLASGVERLRPNSVIAGDRSFVDLASIVEDQRPLNHYAAVFSPSLDDRAWDERAAINSALSGVSPDEFVAAQRKALKTWGPWARDMKKRDERMSIRVGIYDAAAKEPTSTADRFDVRYFAWAKDRRRPDYLDRGWRLLQDGPTWEVWERSP